MLASDKKIQQFFFKEKSHYEGGVKNFKIEVMSFMDGPFPISSQTLFVNFNFVAYEIILTK